MNAVQRLYPSQLGSRLSRGLEPCYLIFGEETLQRSEALAAILAAARQQDFTEVERFALEGETQWTMLADALQSLSLFATRRVISVDIGDHAIATQPAELLTHYAQNMSPDIILILHGGKLDKKAQNGHWFKTCAEHGPYIQALPLQGDRLVSWLRARCQQYGLRLSQEALQRMLDAFEGNMLALAQELEKLALLYPQQQLGIGEIEQSLVDQSRFNTFQLVDTLLAGHTEQGLHMLQQLRETGQEPVIIAWSFARELLQLIELHQAQQQGTLAQAFKSLRVWNSRQPLLRQALARLDSPQFEQLSSRLALLDRQLKGTAGGEREPWSLLAELCLLFAATPHDHPPMLEEKW